MAKHGKEKKITDLGVIDGMLCQYTINWFNTFKKMINYDYFYYIIVQIFLNLD